MKLLVILYIFLFSMSLQAKDKYKNVPLNYGCDPSCVVILPTPNGPNRTRVPVTRVNSAEQVWKNGFPENFWNLNDGSSAGIGFGGSNKYSPDLHRPSLGPTNPHTMPDTARNQYDADVQEYLNDQGLLMRAQQRLNEYRDFENSIKAPEKKRRLQNELDSALALLGGFNLSDKKDFKSEVHRADNPIPKSLNIDAYLADLTEVVRLSKNSEVFELYSKLSDLYSMINPMLEGVSDDLSDEEVLIFKEQFKFIVNELKFKGVLDENGLINMHNIEQAALPLMTGEFTEEGQAVRFIFNHTIVTRSNEVSACSEFNRFDKLCRTLDVKSELINSALHIIDEQLNLGKITNEKLVAVRNRVALLNNFSVGAVDGLINVGFVAKEVIMANTRLPGTINDFVESPEVLGWIYNESMSIFSDVISNQDLFGEAIELTAIQLKNSIQGSFNDFMNASDEEQAYAIGKIFGEELFPIGMLGKSFRGFGKSMSKDLFSKGFLKSTLDSAKKAGIKTEGGYRLFTTRRSKNSWEGSLYDRAYGLGIRSSTGTKVFEKIYPHIDDIPRGRKVSRIKEGFDPSKIAVIGRNMPGVVNVAASHFIKRGLTVKTFADSEAFNKLLQRTTEYNQANKIKNPKSYLPNSELVKTEIYRSNKKWAEKLIKDGYTIIDMGNPLGGVMSPFYSLEKKIIFGK